MSIMIKSLTKRPRFASRLSVAMAIVASFAAASASACTLWAAAGPLVSGGGTLLSKNRDWLPGQTQVLKYDVPRHGIPYFGLYAVDGRAPGIKSGINQKGLSAVTASASSIPHRLRASQPGKHGVLSHILSRYASVDEMAAHASSLFPHARAMFLMVSDRDKILVAEIGLNGRYAYKVLDRGVTAHTNYYLDKTLADLDIKVGRSSATRYTRVNELLERSAKPYDMARFTAISRDHHDGPNNSLWRDGREATLSSWIISSPPQGPQTLRVVLDNPGVPETIQTFTLDDAFWAKATRRG